MTHTPNAPIHREHLDALGHAIQNCQSDIRTLKQFENTGGRERPLTETNLNPIEQKAFTTYLKQGGNFIQETKSLDSGDSTGGALVPEEVSSEIYTQLKERSFFRGLARVTQISSNALETLVSENNLDTG